MTRTNISFINISAIYRDWLHSPGTRSVGKLFKVASTNLYTIYIFVFVQNDLSLRVKIIFIFVFVSAKNNVLIKVQG